MQITSSQRDNTQQQQLHQQSVIPMPITIPKLPQLDKILIEEKAESLTFNQIQGQIQNQGQEDPNNQSIPSSFFTPRTSNISIGIDKDKLYETFVLFHNFMNVSQTTPRPIAKQMPTQTPYSNEDSMKKRKSNLQEKIDQIAINKSVESPSDDRPQLAQSAHRNYDDIPIKSLNGNFIELVEKNLLIDKPDDYNHNNNKDKRIIKRERTKEKLPKLYKTYQKPFYAAALTEGRFSNKKFKSKGNGNYNRFALYKGKDKKDNEAPRRVMTNMKYEQMSKSLRKTNTEFQPYMTLTTEDIVIPINSDQSGSKDEEDNGNDNEEIRLKDKEKDEGSIYSNRKYMNRTNDNNNTDNDIDKAQKGEEPEAEGDILIQSKSEESFHIITEASTDNKPTIHITQPNDYFSNQNSDDESNPNLNLNKDNKPDLNKQINIISNSPLNHQPNIPSIEIEPIQLNTIPISSKLFQQTPIINQRYITEHHYDKKLQRLNDEIQLFQDERSKVLLLKQEYENLHRRLEKEINELSIQRTKFERWKDEETKKIQLERKANEKEKKTIGELKKENQSLKANENQYKNQIEKLGMQVKELKKKNKEYKNASLSSSGKIKGNYNDNTVNTNTNTSVHTYANTHRNTQISNTTKLLKQPIPKDISFTSPNQIPTTSITNYNTHIISNKKTMPNKPPVVLSQSQSQSQTHSTTKDKDKDKETYDLSYPEEYSNKQYTVIKQEKTSDGKEIKWYSNDKKEIVFPSGVRKEIYNNDGFQIVFFANGDIKQIYKNCKTVYYFKEAKTIQTIFDNGLQVFKFHNGQIEKHFPDGKKEIFFVDGSYRVIRSDGSEETFFSDGTIQRIDVNNVVTIETKAKKGQRKEIGISK